MVSPLRKSPRSWLLITPAREAALACRLLGAREVVPMHYGTFPILAGSPGELRELTRDIPGFRVSELKPGQTL